MSTVDELIVSIQKRGILPTDDNTLGEADIIRFAYEELISYIAPLVKEVNEEYFVNWEDVTLVAGKTTYQISYRAMGGILRDVLYIDSNNNTRNLTRISPSDIPDLVNSQTGEPTAFYINDNSVILTSIPSGGGSLRIKFFMRPSSLVKTSSAGRIVAFNHTNKTVEINTTPTSFTSGLEYDFVKGKPGFEIQDWDLIPTNISGTTFTFASLPENLAIGDYLCLARTSCVPQIPEELHPMLSQTVVVRMLDALTHTEALNNALGKLKKMEEALPKLIGNRVLGEATGLRIKNNLLDYTRK